MSLPDFKTEQENYKRNYKKEHGDLEGWAGNFRVHMLNKLIKADRSDNSYDLIRRVKFLDESNYNLIRHLIQRDADNEPANVIKAHEQQIKADRKQTKETEKLFKSTKNVHLNSKLSKGLRKMFKSEDAAFQYTIVNFAALNTPYRGPVLDYFNLMRRFIKKLIQEKLVHFSDESLNTCIEAIMKKIEEYQRNSSGWIYQFIDTFYVNIASYQPLKGSSYVELPSELKLSHACVNIKNTDNKCFKWCLLAHLHPAAKDANRTSKYLDYWNEIIDTGITYPVTLNDIPKMEKLNNLKINVYSYENKTMAPIYVNPENPFDAINILLFKDHYVLIRDFDKLMFSHTKHKAAKHFCMRCLHCCSSRQSLLKHQETCKNFDTVRPIMPTGKDIMLHFKNYKNKMQVPYVIYADFECLTTELETNPELNTNKYQRHDPCGFCYQIVSIDPNYQPEPVVYRGPNAHEKLVEKLLEEQKQLMVRIKNVVPVKPLTREQRTEYNEADTCHICEGPIQEKALDHCHITGEYRGAACNGCNLNYQNKPVIPVIFHNLKNYDSHFIIQVAGKYTDKIDCIPLNLEKYISFSIGNLRFIDSFQFMASSLETLATNLKKGGIKSFKHTSKYFKGKQLDLITEKGVYPYDYMNKMEKFDETELPTIEQFYSKLTENHLSKEDYEHAQKVWKAFGIKNMGEYHDLYMKSDVLLLADVFESFREVCMKIYHLDPCHYYTAPGLSWDAMLYKTKVNLELLTDLEMHMFIEMGMRGGISCITQRYAKANNKYMKKYNQNKKSSYIMYLDANNLYGYAMSQYLPKSGFKWVSSKRLVELNDEPQKLLEIRDDADTGCILEVDIEIPLEIHDKMNDYPIAESLTIVEDMYSPYCTQSAEKLEIKGDSVKKLVPSLMNKTRGVEFYQEAWLKKYIDFNTSQRAVAKNDFEKDFFKLMNNSVFGKTMENVRNHIKAKLCCNEKQKDYQMRKPRCKTWKIFNENMAIIELQKDEAKLNKPIYAGFSILDLSKGKVVVYRYRFLDISY